MAKTDEQKRNGDLDLMNSIEYIKDGDIKNAVLYLRGDVEFQNAIMVIKGDVTLLANTMIHHIDNNPEFKQYILAVIGSWLIKHPEEEKMFIQGLELTKKQNEMYIVKKEEL